MVCSYQLLQPFTQPYIASYSSNESQKAETAIHFKLAGYPFATLGAAHDICYAQKKNIIEIFVAQLF